MKTIGDTLQEWLDSPVVTRLLTILIGLIVILLLRHFVRRAMNRQIKSSENRYRARKAANFGGFLLMIVLVLFVYSDKLGNIGVALGVAGAGIAFALQEVIVSLAGWLHIILTGSVSAGERVKIGDVKGDIIDIGVISTTIMEIGDWVDGDMFNGRIVTVANSFVFKEKVHNYSAQYPFLWDEIKVPVRTESDYKRARVLFQEVLTEVCGEYAAQSASKWKELAGKYRVEEAQVEPMVALQFDENWITFTLRYIVDYKKRRSTKDRIFTRLLDEIAKDENIIMIATSTLEVTNIVQTEDEDSA